MRRFAIPLGIVVLTLATLLVFTFADALGRGGGGRGGGGGGRGGGGFSGGARPGGGGGGFSRPSGGGAAGVSGASGGHGGGGMSRPGGVGGGGGGGISHSPGFGSPGRPAVQPGGGLGNRGPGQISGPGLTPGSRPEIGSGQRPGIGSGQRPGVGAGQRPEIGSKGNRPGIENRPGGPGGNRPSVLPGMGLGAAGGYLAGRSGDILGRRQDRVGDRRENLGQRSDNLQNRLEDRQNFRNENQDQRQEFLNNRREDWQNWHDDYFGHYNDWYHGAWCDHWGDWWSHMWSDHTAAMVLGTTAWGLNRMGYWFGTDSYVNPYYTEPYVVEGTSVDYSQPLAVPPEMPAQATPQTAELPPGVTQEGLTAFEAARSAFNEGDYQKSLTETNKALVTMPKDAVIHEFRALVLFALGKYHDAAVTLHPVLAVGPGWDWTTMCSLYANVDTYTQQLRALEAFVDNNPKAADARFVLAYQYLTCGYSENAAKELAKVQKAVPNDTVTAQLLQMLGKAGTQPTFAPESDIKIDPAVVEGTWTATRGPNARFEMTLGKDKGFTWVYQEGKKRQEVKGAYALDGNQLALEPDAGGVMLAEITPPQNGAFEFRTVGAPKTDKGLRFEKK